MPERPTEDDALEKIEPSEDNGNEDERLGTLRYILSAFSTEVLAPVISHVFSRNISKEEVDRALGDTDPD